jgi:hypothetical protein
MVGRCRSSMAGRSFPRWCSQGDRHHSPVLTLAVVGVYHPVAARQKNNDPWARCADGAAGLGGLGRSPLHGVPQAERASAAMERGWQLLFPLCQLLFEFADELRQRSAQHPEDRDVTGNLPDCQGQGPATKCPAPGGSRSWSPSELLLVGEGVQVPRGP